MGQAQIKIKIGEILTDILKEKNLTQKKLGEILGINPQCVSMLMNNEYRKYSLCKLFIFLAILGYDAHIHISKSLNYIGELTSQRKIGNDR